LIDEVFSLPDLNDFKVGKGLQPVDDSDRYRVVSDHLLFLRRYHQTVKFERYHLPVVRQLYRKDLEEAARLMDLKRVTPQKMLPPLYLETTAALFLQMNPFSPVDINCEKFRQIVERQSLINIS
jgi:hypothetical protein